MTITREHIVQWLVRTATVLDANKDYLTQLDSPIGDADHGVNMSRGFNKVLERLPGLAGQDIGAILQAASQALISGVGGASGPLYGTFFKRAAAAGQSLETLTGEELLKLLRAGVDGIAQRGRAQVGDKTMLDAWSPALAALQATLADGGDTVAGLRAAVAAAEQGMAATIPLQARKGRASYLGERSIGHQDPGATSSYLMLKALLETLEDGSG
jgi:dihydroxyacetone kinase-like protein